jgi:pyruvate kinase
MHRAWSPCPSTYHAHPIDLRAKKSALRRCCEHDVRRTKALEIVYGPRLMTIRHAKLVCTLGPACDSPEGLESLIDAGMDVARFNFSHGTHKEHGARLARLRKAGDAKRKSVAALQDLCGPKIRTGIFPAPFDLPQGSEVTLIEGEKSDDETVIPIHREGLAGDVRLNDKILFDDGRLVLTVKRIEGERVIAYVDQGGGMRNHIGVHLPSKTMRGGALTEKDKEDLSFGLANGVDYIALSFVRRAEDIKLVRDITAEWGQPTPIIAKIETPDAIENLESIVASSDGVMVARGDLGVEFPPERVPVIQRQILNVARRVRRPVIVATEMLQSMTKAQRPTRAEASDVANAVFSGTDAVMLSGETATGDYPLLVLRNARAVCITRNEHRRSDRTRRMQHRSRNRRALPRRIHRNRIERDERKPRAPQRSDHRVLAESKNASQDGALLGRHSSRSSGRSRHRRVGRLVHG